MLPVKAYDKKVPLQVKARGPMALTDFCPWLQYRTSPPFWRAASPPYHKERTLSEAQIKEHPLRPYFDMEGFMTMSHETRLGGAVLQRLVDLWGQWLPKLKVCEISTGKIAYLAVWLPEEVEELVDAAWEKSASDGFMVNNLAQFMCMAAVQELLPEVENAGCAPSPRPTEALARSLGRSGPGIPGRGRDSCPGRIRGGDPLSF